MSSPNIEFQLLEWKTGLQCKNHHHKASSIIHKILHWLSGINSNTIVWTTQQPSFNYPCLNLLSDYGHNATHCNAEQQHIYWAGPIRYCFCLATPIDRPRVPTFGRTCRHIRPISKQEQTSSLNLFFLCVRFGNHPLCSLSSAKSTCTPTSYNNNNDTHSLQPRLKAGHQEPNNKAHTAGTRSHQKFITALVRHLHTLESFNLASLHMHRGSATWPKLNAGVVMAGVLPATVPGSDVRELYWCTADSPR